MRQRVVKPEFLRHEGLGELSPLHRILFVGLWCLADREGRLRDRPAQIKLDVLPWDRCDVHRMLADLAAHRQQFIQRYRVCDTPYIQVNKFVQHQRPHPHEEASRIPPPESATKSTMPCNVMAEPDNVRLEPDIVRRSRSESESESESESLSSRTQKETVGFADFWCAWPSGKRGGKKAAEVVWRQLEATDRRHALDGIAVEQRGERWQRGIVPHAVTWLRQRRWEDPPPAWQRPETALEIAARRLAEAKQGEGDDAERGGRPGGRVVGWFSERKVGR